MIIDHIHEGPAIQTVIRTENLLGLPGCFMIIRKCINCPVEGYSTLYTGRIIKFFLPFYMITDHITNQYFRVTERKICMGQVVQALKIMHKVLPVLRKGCCPSAFVVYITGKNIYRE